MSGITKYQPPAAEPFLISAKSKRSVGVWSRFFRQKQLVIQDRNPVIKLDTVLITTWIIHITQLLDAPDFTDPSEAGPLLRLKLTPLEFKPTPLSPGEKRKLEAHLKKCLEALKDQRLNLSAKQNSKAPYTVDAPAVAAGTSAPELTPPPAAAAAGEDTSSNEERLVVQGTPMEGMQNNGDDVIRGVPVEQNNYGTVPDGLPVPEVNTSVCPTRGG